jgi:hypothetical protein
MEIVKDFFNDKDEEKFLQRCGDLCTLIEETPKKRIYRVDKIADVHYFPKIKQVSVIYFQTP